ncbi:YgjP-like metallopeptidase domain-containing protein [Streptomyces sp. MMG1533]|uniref:YgjP-like metallopeptidase domain-containing protein n=1 Tax=Streptomyces sp. MMG1533 TaxID=1415546 RepID=UPI0006B02ADF|nr:YgjP-like metallopeptidase domain-containing protein [Streptomyces sp. MMG1533]
MTAPAAVTAEAIREALATDPRLAKHVTHIQISARRKTLGMAMSPGDDGITLQVPADATPGEVLRLLSKNRDRIGVMLNKAKKCVPGHPVKTFIGGEGFLWLGRSARLRLVDNPDVKLRHASGYGTGYWFELDSTAVPNAATTFIDWYIREGTAWIQVEAEQIWSRMAPRRPMPTVKVGNIGRTRWGKHDGRPGRDDVTIAWQTLQLDPPLVRHVLTHELTHATRPGGTSHGPEFWRTFERAEVDARQTARRLDEEGRHIWMGDVRQGPA